MEQEGSRSSVGAKVHVAVEALRAPTPKAGAGAPREATVCTTTELAFRVPTKLEQAAVSSVLNTSVPDAAHGQALVWAPTSA